MKAHRFLPLVALALSSMICQATHIRGGEIRYTYIGAVPGGQLYEIVVHLYTDPTSPADRPEVILHIDNSVDTVQRTAILPQAGNCSTQLCIYPTEYVFTATGTAQLWVEDPNRMAAIANIPNSVDEPFVVQATLIIDGSGSNSSPRFNASQTDLSYGWSWLLHDPQVTEPDGDSLNFELVTCLGADLNSNGLGDPVPGYLLPDEVTSFPSDFTWVDPATGVFLWDQPNMMGNFQIAIQCTERRLVNGTWTIIGRVTRDMSLCVYQLPTGIAEPSSTELPLLTPIGSYGLYTVAARFADLRVLDAAGRSVLQLGPVPSGTIDLSSLTSGTYTVVARDVSGPLRSARVALVR